MLSRSRLATQIRSAKSLATLAKPVAPGAVRVCRGPFLSPNIGGRSSVRNVSSVDAVFMLTPQFLSSELNRLLQGIDILQVVHGARDLPAAVRKPE